MNLLFLGIAVSAAAPQVKCEIALSSWCIAGVGAVVSMNERKKIRTWEIVLPYVDSIPLIVTESPECRRSFSTKPAVIEKKFDRTSEISSVKILLSKESGCILDISTKEVGSASQFSSLNGKISAIKFCGGFDCSAYNIRLPIF